MTVAAEIRAALRNAAAPLTSAEVYEKCPSAESAKQVGISIHSFVERGEATHSKVLGQQSGTYLYNPRYMSGRTPPAGKQEATAASAKAQVDYKAPPAPAPIERPAERVRANGAAAKSKPAKRQYKKRTPPQALPVPAVASAAPALAPAMFYVGDDGRIGIAMNGAAVHLPATEVQRLQAFIDQVKPLWSKNA